MVIVLEGASFEVGTGTVEHSYFNYGEVCVIF
jgi:hypothetical protein